MLDPVQCQVQISLSFFKSILEPYLLFTVAFSPCAILLHVVNNHCLAQFHKICNTSISSVLLYCCPDCPSFPANAIQMALHFGNPGSSRETQPHCDSLSRWATPSSPWVASEPPGYIGRWRRCTSTTYKPSCAGEYQLCIVFHKFIAAQIAQVAQSMLFKLAGRLGQSEHQWRNTELEFDINSLIFHHFFLLYSLPLSPSPLTLSHPIDAPVKGLLK